MYVFVLFYEKKEKVKMPLGGLMMNDLKAVIIENFYRFFIKKNPPMSTFLYLELFSVD